MIAGSHNSSWTEERAALLTKMWLEGHSASQCAKALGGVSRNACIGKVNRLGLQRTKASSDITRKLSATHNKGPRIGSIPRPSPRPVPGPTLRLVPTTLAPEPDANAPTFASATIIDLNSRHQCGFGLGGEGADALFCAEPKVGVFCAHHTKIGTYKAAKPPPNAFREQQRRPMSRFDRWAAGGDY